MPHKIFLASLQELSTHWVFFQNPAMSLAQARRLLTLYLITSCTKLRAYALFVKTGNLGVFRVKWGHIYSL